MSAPELSCGVCEDPIPTTIPATVYTSTSRASSALTRFLHLGTRAGGFTQSASAPRTRIPTFVIDVIYSAYSYRARIAPFWPRRRAARAAHGHPLRHLPSLTLTY